MAKEIIFCILAVVILGSAFMSVMTKSIMRAATFLLFVLFGIAGLYFILGYTFLGTAQISVYAGGVTMMYIFAISLTGKRTLQNLTERFKGSRVFNGILVSVFGLVAVLFVFFKNALITCAIDETPVGEVSVQKIGEAIVGSEKYGYVLPFEFISVFLFACIIGGIMIARKENDK